MQYNAARKIKYTNEAERLKAHEEIRLFAEKEGFKNYYIIEDLGYVILRLSLVESNKYFRALIKQGKF